MELTEKQLDLLSRRKVLVLATSSSGCKPRAIFVKMNKIEGDEIIITDGEMNITRNNLLENKDVFLLAFEEDYHYGFKISGEAEYHAQGEYLDFVKNLKRNENHSPKGAVVIRIKSIVEFE